MTCTPASAIGPGFSRSPAGPSAICSPSVNSLSPKVEKASPCPKGRYARTREITIDASEDVVDKLYAVVQMNFDLGR